MRLNGIGGLEFGVGFEVAQQDESDDERSTVKEDVLGFANKPEGTRGRERVTDDHTMATVVPGWTSTSMLAVPRRNATGLPMELSPGKE